MSGHSLDAANANIIGSGATAATVATTSASHGSPPATMSAQLFVASISASERGSIRASVVL